MRGWERGGEGRRGERRGGTIEVEKGRRRESGSQRWKEQERERGMER